jgi:hypothetical protein
MFLGEPTRHLAQTRAGDFELGRGCDVASIETARILEERGVTAPAHVRDDIAHRRLYRGIERLGTVEQALELGLKIRISGFQYAQSYFHKKLEIRENAQIGLQDFSRLTGFHF